ncbi:hypothetical protein NM688_g8715 [Phlebia brevispora]|uniref:Uncharacterized protein n=1 Tax=Phlebia brevispora TaxID=194682 RepID=A0ACC1RNP9_9APHY|nr:hypothetical protein NM688_g8715 [Phlebia brevispora]
MGIGGTWVQLARRDMSVGESAEDLRPICARNMSDEELKPGGPGEMTEPTEFWYLEDKQAFLASFHTDQYYSDQD